MEAIDRTDMSGNCKWAVRGKNKKYWQLGAGTSNIVCDAVSCSDVKAQFSFEWMGPQVCCVILLGVPNGVTIMQQME